MNHDTLKNKTIKPSAHLLVLVLALLLIALKTGDYKAEYLIPAAANSIFAYDLDLDGDIDIVTGHHNSSQTQWGGVSFLINNGSGYFNNQDSLFVTHGFPFVNGDYFDTNNYIDVFSLTAINNPYTIYATIIYNYGLTQFKDIKSFPIYYAPPMPYITSGDVTGNGVADILFAHNNHQLWGIIYNDGSGNFSAPETFSLGFFPNGIACDDVTGNEKADIVLAGSYTIIIFSTETGFQQQVLGYTPSFSGGYTLLITDFDNDGDKDILVSVKYYNNHNRIYMFENLGGGQFLQHDFFEFTPFCSYAVAADFNNDSLPDLAFIASDYSGLYIYRNKGEFYPVFQQFIPINSGGSPIRRISSSDFDKNGYMDIGLVLFNNYPIPVNLVLLYNDGDGNFIEEPITDINTTDLENFSASMQIFPNPFSKETTIAVNTEENEASGVHIYDLEGKLIKSYDNMQLRQFDYKILWNGKDLNGKEVKPGIYLLGFAVNGQPNHTIKLIKM
jgi:hypothetical protein